MQKNVPFLKQTGSDFVSSKTNTLGVSGLSIGSYVLTQDIDSTFGQICVLVSLFFMALRDTLDRIIKLLEQRNKGDK